MQVKASKVTAAENVEQDIDDTADEDAEEGLLPAKKEESLSPEEEPSTSEELEEADEAQEGCWRQKKRDDEGFSIGDGLRGLDGWWQFTICFSRLSVGNLSMKKHFL